MNKVVNLDDYRKSNQLEEEYLKFLTHVNKFVGIPTNVCELTKAFYFILRYMEGTINCFETLSILKPMPEKEMNEMRQMVVNYLNGLSQDLQKY